MLLNTLELKQGHHIAKKIPNYLWDVVFWSELDTDLIPNHRTIHLRRLSEEQTLVILLICYPQILPIALIYYASNKLKLSADCIFGICAAMNRTDLLDFFDKNDLPHLIEGDDFINFNWAAASGADKSLEWFKKQAPLNLEKMIEARDYRAFQSSCEFGQIKSAEWIVEKVKHKTNELCKTITYPMLSRIMAKGYAPMVEWLKQLSPGKLTDMLANINSAGYVQVLLSDERVGEDILSLVNLPNDNSNEISDGASALVAFSIFSARIVCTTDNTEVQDNSLLNNIN